MGRRSIPRVHSPTVRHMVPMVLKLKTRATSATSLRLSWAAGYMRSGIRGSQGPNTKMVNNTQGVRVFVVDAWS